jgi:hypothetical protein
MQGPGPINNVPPGRNEPARASTKDIKALNQAEMRSIFAPQRVSLSSRRSNPRSR